jgi:hypothetical protein
MKTEFQAKYLEYIAIQRQQGTICAACRKTEIEHRFEPSKTCFAYRTEKEADPEGMDAV